MTPEQVWNHIGGRGERPSRINRYSGPLLIMGGGRTVWDDYAKVRPWKGEIMVINDIGMHLHERVRHWVTLHPEYMAGWMFYRQRHLLGSGDKPMTHSNKSKPDIDTVWALENVGGTSGLFGVYVGLMLGYNEILLAGIPMTNDGHYFDAPWYRTDFADRATEIVWMWARDNVFAGRVKSLSGVTKEWLD